VNPKKTTVLGPVGPAPLGGAARGGAAAPAAAGHKGGQVLGELRREN